MLRYVYRNAEANAGAAVTPRIAGNEHGLHVYSFFQFVVGVGLV